MSSRLVGPSKGVASSTAEPAPPGAILAEVAGARHTGGMASASERLVWILRHAKTQVPPPPGGHDYDRRLTARGKRDADALGQRLAATGDRLGLAPPQLPALVLCSSAARTTQTAQRVWAPSGSAAPPIDYLRPLYHASSEQVLGRLREVEDGGVRSVMVVGHNPTVHHLVGDLCSSDDERGRELFELLGFPTCALAVLAVPAEEWTDLATGTGRLLELLVPPYGDGSWVG
jgi:phosphohistidine phosphatase